jgi:hypothetical protein
MTRVDFNAIFCTAWLTWTRQQQLELGAGGNSIMTGWRGTGLHPYNRDAPYWSAAIAQFGQREELALAQLAHSSHPLRPRASREPEGSVRASAERTTAPWARDGRNKRSD